MPLIVTIASAVIFAFTCLTGAPQRAALVRHKICIFGIVLMAFGAMSFLLPVRAHVWLGSIFGASISNVVLSCSNKQMGVVYAWGVIAFMAYAKSFWNFPEMKLPRKSMSMYFHMFSRNLLRENAVAAFFSSSVPFPAAIGFIDTFPESFLVGSHAMIISRNSEAV